MNKRAACIFGFLLVLTCHVTAQQISVTRLKENYLRDDVGLLDREQRSAIINILERQAKKSLGRIYLDIIETLPEGQSVEQYARRRLNEHPRMADEKADKIMLVVVVKDRFVRIETSRDVSQILTDDYCHQVNREIMIPRFKSGGYYAGIKAGIEALIKKLEKP